MTTFLNLLHTFGPGILAALIALLPSVITGLSPAHPEVSAVASFLLKACQFLSGLTAKDQPGTLKLPFKGIGPKTTTTTTTTTTVVALLFLLFAGSARAQEFSAGLSVPVLEFKTKIPNPIQFAPGAGVEGNVCFFPAALAGQEVDLLCFSAAAFAQAPGSLQVAIIVGTLSGLIGFGAAVPLVAADGSGAFQGSFNVYPVISGAIAFSLYSAPPETASASSTPKPGSARRLGTVYLGILKGRE